MRICLFGSGFIVGWTIWQCSIVAPTLSSALDAKMFSKVMRKLWPKFFLGNLTTGILSCFALFYEGNSPISNFCIPISTACLSFVCYAIIPIMNNASELEIKDASKCYTSSVYGPQWLFWSEI